MEQEELAQEHTKYTYMRMCGCGCGCGNVDDVDVAVYGRSTSWSEEQSSDASVCVDVDEGVADISVAVYHVWLVMIETLHRDQSIVHAPSSSTAAAAAAAAAAGDEVGGVACVDANAGGVLVTLDVRRVRAAVPVVARVGVLVS